MVPTSAVILTVLFVNSVYKILDLIFSRGIYVVISQ